MAAPAADTPPVLPTVTWRGLPIVIENLAGSYREWTDRDGKSGRTAMQWPYGYFADHLGADGDELDCYIGPDENAPFVYVVHQLATPDYIKFDEDKVFLGFASEQAAKAVFMQHRSDGDRAYGGMSVIPIERFLSKLKARSGTGKIRHSRTAARGEGSQVMDNPTPPRTAISMRGEIVAKLPSGRALTDGDLRRILGGVQRFDAGPAGDVPTGIWDRGATFGAGPDGRKEKDGEEVQFTVDTFRSFTDNWYARGGRMPLSRDHQSALGGIVAAPALAKYDAFAIVHEGVVVYFKALATSQATAPDVAQLAEQVKRLATKDNPAPSPDGWWGYRCEVTPLGQSATEGLRNYEGISPLFVMNGTDEQGNEIGPVCYDWSVVNVQFQAGCQTFAGMSAAENALHDVAPIGEKPKEKVTMAVLWDQVKPGVYLKDRNGIWAKVTGVSGERAQVTQEGGGSWYLTSGDLLGIAEVTSVAPAGKTFSVTFGATAMATVADLNIGDRVRNAKTGNAGTITEKKADGSAHVKWEGADGDGWFYPGAPLPPEISKMSAASNEATAMAKFNPGDKARISDSYPTANARGQEVTIGRSEPWSPTGEEAYWVNDGFTNRWVRAVDLVKMSATPGAAGEGAKSMNPEMMKKMGFADGANPSVEEKMAAYAKHCMGEASQEEIKAMVADLEASGDDKAKAMAKKMGDLVIKHEDDDPPAAEIPAAMAAQFSALSAANGALASKLAALEADKAARDAANRAAEEQKFSALADEAVAGGYPKEERDALITFARSNFAAAQKLVAPFVAAPATLFTRTHTGSTAPASVPGVKRTGNVVRYGMDLSEAIKRIQKEDKVSFERAAQLAGERHPDLLRNYEAHQGN